MERPHSLKILPNISTHAPAPALETLHHPAHYHLFPTKHHLASAFSAPIRTPQLVVSLQRKATAVSVIRITRRPPLYWATGAAWTGGMTMLEEAHIRFEVIWDKPSAL
eukprot:9493645-Pyramimonas_sp.AAC.1